MVYYLVYRALKEYKDRGTIPRRLRALGCIQVHRSLWKVKEEDANEVLKVLQNNKPVLLKRVREIRKPSSKGKTVSELGSLVIIMYKVPNEVKRDKIKNFLKKAPCIQLRRSTYAFYQNHTHFDKNRDLVDAGRFWKFIQEIDEEAKAIPRVVVINSESIERILEQAKKRIENEVANIIIGLNSLHKKLSAEENNERNVRKTFLVLKRRFDIVRKLATFYEKWLKIDLSKSLLKPYPTIKKVRSLINEKYDLL